jgi:hypothetical protein
MCLRTEKWNGCRAYEGRRDGARGRGQPALLNVVRRTLESLRLSRVHRDDGERGRAISQNSEQGIDVLVTDLVLPYEQALAQAVQIPA